MIEGSAPGSLAEALAVVADPRRPYGWRPGHEPIPLVALLQPTVVALLTGARSQWAAAQWGRERLDDDPALLETLGLPPGRSPCVATLHRVYKQLDVAVFEAALGAWLARTGSQRSGRESLAIDGKVLRGSQPKQADEPDRVTGTYLVAAYAHASGVVKGQVRAAGKGYELAAAEALLKQVPIAGRVVTADDDLLTQRDISEQVAIDRGDYLLPIDSNQPALLADAEAALSLMDGAPSSAQRRADGGDDPANLAPAWAHCARRTPQLVHRRLAEGAPRSS